DPAAYLAGALPAAPPRRPSISLPLPPPVSVVALNPTTLTRSAAEVQAGRARGARVGVMVVSGLAALALLGGAAFWLRSRPDEPPPAPVAAESVAAAPLPAPAPPPPPSIVEPTSPPAVSLSFVSEPPGADLFVGGELRGKTPLVLELPRADAELPVTFRLAGYRERTRSVRTAHDAAVDVTLEKLLPPTKKPAQKSAKPLDD